MFKFLQSQLNCIILLGIFFFLKVSVFVLKPGGYFQIRNNQIVRNSLTRCLFFYYLFFQQDDKEWHFTTEFLISLMVFMLLVGFAFVR